MKRAIGLLRVISLVLVLGGLIFWAARGANRGWSKTQVPTVRIDPVTELEFTTYEKRFVPGVDFLGAALALGVGLWACSLVLSGLSSKYHENRT